MRKLAIVCVLTCVMTVVGSTSFASITLTLNVDSGPNVYGSPNWAPWWAAAKADVVSGTFTDMRTGTYAGTHYYDPYDEIVYSTMDLGKRLHWIYWLPGETVAGLEGLGLFEVKWSIDWGGDSWTYEGGGWAADAPEAGWSEPSNWEDYAGGVIGSVGFAWWSTDNDAPPVDTGGNPYDEVDQADIDALRDVVLDAQTYALGQIRYRETVNDEWQYLGIELSTVPEPVSLIVWSFLGTVGYVTTRRRRAA